jgi:hypothetical protein
MAHGNRRFFTCRRFCPVILVDQASVTFPTDQLPRRYRIDENGRRVLVGLSVEETFEFETLEDIPPWMRQSGHVPWQDGVPITTSENRWLELYQKHEEAWKALMAATVSRRSPNDPS